MYESVKNHRLLWKNITKQNKKNKLVRVIVSADVINPFHRYLYIQFRYERI